MAIALERVAYAPVWRKITGLSQLTMGDVWVIAGTSYGGVVSKSYPTYGDISTGKLYTCKPPAG